MQKGLKELQSMKVRHDIKTPGLGIVVERLLPKRYAGLAFGVFGHLGEGGMKPMNICLLPAYRDKQLSASSSN
jgi:hypothetical protein